MPQALPVISAIGAATSVVGTIQSYRQGRKASKAQEQQQELSDRRERMQAIRQAQIQRASSVMSAVGSGSAESSGAAGGIGAISSQLGTQMGYGSQMTALSKDIGAASSRQSMWGGMANLGMTAFNAAGGFGAFGERSQQSPFQSEDPGPSGFYSPRPMRNPIYG